MQKNMDWKFDLTLFDGDGGAGAGAAGDGGGEGASTGVQGETPIPTNPNRRRRENPLANVPIGKHPQAQAPVEEPAQPATQEETPDDRMKRWQAVKEEFRDLYSGETSEFVQKRLANSKQAEETLAKLAPVFEGLGKKYGKEAGDIDGIIAAYTDDDSLYEEDAAKAGMSVQAFKQLKQLQDDKAAREAQEAQFNQQRAMQQYFQNLHNSFENEVKNLFPQADLRKEMQNPKFARLVSPQVGVSVRDAYWLVHRAELEPQAMQIAAQKTQQKLSQSIQSGMNRPTENGSRNVSPGLEIHSDPSKWSKEVREEAKRRARMGEKVYL